MCVEKNIFLKGQKMRVVFIIIILYYNKSLNLLTIKTILNIYDSNRSNPLL